jgi:uncharacterized protein YaaQ
MKMIIAIVRDEDRENISSELIKAGLRVTRIASTGGFLKRGSTTMMIGLTSERLEEAIQIIRKNCSTTTGNDTRRVTLFVINVTHFEQI